MNRIVRSNIETDYSRSFLYNDETVMYYYDSSYLAFSSWKVINNKVYAN